MSTSDINAPLSSEVVEEKLIDALRVGYCATKGG